MYSITYLVILSVTGCLRWHSNTKNTNTGKRMHLPNTEVAGQLLLVRLKWDLSLKWPHEQPYRTQIDKVSHKQ